MLRRLEHIAAGIKHKIRALAGFRGGAILEALVYILAKTRKVALAQLHARENVHTVRNQSEILNALLAPVAQFRGALGEGDARHRQEGARIDGFVACLDAIASQRAALGPCF
jgi:hypothetical protein